MPEPADEAGYCARRATGKHIHSASPGARSRRTGLWTVAVTHNNTRILMATGITAWQIVDGTLKPVDSTLAECGRTEPYDLEEWIAKEPVVVADDIVIIGRQIHTHSGPLDLLAVDRLGNTVIIELKREKLPREALAQAIDYASDIATWGVEKIGEICLEYTGKQLEDLMLERFPDVDLENLTVNQEQRILLVGFAVGAALERMIGWLSSSYGVSVNAVILKYLRTSSGDEILAKTAIISEELAQDRSKRRKFRIATSDEPGTYDFDELRDHLRDYLSHNQPAAQRVRDVFLPILLEHDVLPREELKAEMVARGAAETLGAAGYALTSVSLQLGMARHDFLRQVVGYDYPRYEWEKDNYFLRPEHRQLVAEVLAELTAAG